jgi:isopenicillin N synthase-like dioxygenase
VVRGQGTAMFSIRPHADGGIFTILANDGEPGLHICLDKELAPSERIWTPVPPRVGSLVVNLGKNGGVDHSPRAQ